MEREKEKETEKRDLYNEILSIRKEDLSPEERLVIEKCGEKVSRNSFLGGLGGFAGSWIVSRMLFFGRPLRLFFVVSNTFAFSYLGIISATMRCREELLSLEGSKLGELYKKTVEVGFTPEDKEMMRSMAIERKHHLETEKRNPSELETEFSPDRPSKWDRKPTSREKRDEDPEDSLPSDSSSERDIDSRPSPPPLEEKPKRRNRYGDIIE